VDVSDPSAKYQPVVFFFASQMVVHSAENNRRSSRLAVLAAVAAALVALTPASAHGATMFVHSARSGELAGGRLTLHGVGPNVTWTSTAGRSGVAPVARAHRRIFMLSAPATGTLHVGHRGGDEPTFRLSRPRYNASRQTVSYRAKPLNNKPLRRRAARAGGRRGARRFGAASLSIVPHSTVLNRVNCYTTFVNATRTALQVGSVTKALTDGWDSGWFPPKLGLYVQANGGDAWESYGIEVQSCGNSVTYKIVGTTDTITFSMSLDGTEYSNTCTSTNPQFVCANQVDKPGYAEWNIVPPSQGS
jgi:hypothetical protein